MLGNFSTASGVGESFDRLLATTIASQPQLLVTANFSCVPNAFCGLREVCGLVLPQVRHYSLWPRQTTNFPLQETEQQKFAVAIVIMKSSFALETDKTQQSKKLSRLLPCMITALSRISSKRKGQRLYDVTSLWHFAILDCCRPRYNKYLMGQLSESQLWSLCSVH